MRVSQALMARNIQWSKRFSHRAISTPDSLKKQNNCPKNKTTTKKHPQTKENKTHVKYLYK